MSARRSPRSPARRSPARRSPHSPARRVRVPLAEITQSELRARLARRSPARLARRSPARLARRSPARRSPRSPRSPARRSPAKKVDVRYSPHRRSPRRPGPLTPSRKVKIDRFLSNLLNTTKHTVVLSKPLIELLKEKRDSIRRLIEKKKQTKPRKWLEDITLLNKELKKVSKIIKSPRKRQPSLPLSSYLHKIR